MNHILYLIWRFKMCVAQKSIQFFQSNEEFFKNSSIFVSLKKCNKRFGLTSLFNASTTSKGPYNHYLNIKFKKLVAKNHIFESTHSALSQHKLKFKRKMWSQIEDMAFEQLTKQLTVNISQIKRIVFFAYTLVPMVAT